MAPATNRLRPALLLTCLGALGATAALMLAADDAAAPGGSRVDAGRATPGTPVATAAGRQADRTAPVQDLGCWGAPIGSRMRHHLDDRCDLAIRSEQGGVQPAGVLHATCDVLTTVLDRRDGETLAECRLEGLQFLGADERPIRDDAQQDHLVAAAAQPVLLRLDARGVLLGYGFADGLDGDQRNYLRGTLGLFAFEAPAAGVDAWQAHAADTTGEFDADYTVASSAPGATAVRRTKLHYTAIAGQTTLPEHELRGTSEATFDHTLGWLLEARVVDGMTLTLPLMDLQSLTERTATIVFGGAESGVVAHDVAAAWARATAPVSGAGELIGGYAAGNERRRWQETLRGVTIDQLLQDLQLVLAAQPVDDDALDGVFQKLQWLLKLDERATAQLAMQLATRQLTTDSARVVLGALGAAGTPAAQQVLAAVRADRGAAFEVRQAATIACLQLAEPDASLVRGMLDEAGSDSDLRQTSLLAFGALAPRSDATLAEGRSPVAALLAMEQAATRRGELDTWLLAVANSNPPETLAIAQRLLGDADPAVRGAACVALRNQPAASALQDLLQRGLTDAEPTVRLEAVLALGRRSEPAARTAIEQVAAQDPDQQVRERAHRILHPGS